VALLWIAAVRARLGGQTGDACGAAQQLAEVAALLALSAA
jgi:cobalamin synthase